MSIPSHDQRQVEVKTAKKKMKANSDKTKKEHDEEVVVVGRNAYFNYLKVKGAELKKNKQGMREVEWKKEISSKWKQLSRKEKAAFCSTIESNNEVSEAGPSGLVNVQKKTNVTIKTRCCVDKFHETVSKFSVEKIEAMKEIGFGILAQFSLTRLHRQLCRFLVDKFDPSRCMIELHGSPLSISSDDFERIMGVPNGVEEVDLSGCLDGEEMKSLITTFCGKQRFALISDLSEKLIMASTVDDNFKIGFMMFAIGTILCPTSATYVSSQYLIALRRPEMIKGQKWASYCLKFLCDGVLHYKATGAKYLHGSAVFLQLYYLDAVSRGCSFVDRSVHPILTWKNETASHVMKWVNNRGGIESTKINIVTQSEKNVGVGGEVNPQFLEVASALRLEVENIKSSVARIEKAISDPIAQKECGCSVSGFKDEILNLLKGIVKDSPLANNNDNESGGVNDKCVGDDVRENENNNDDDVINGGNENDMDCVGGESSVEIVKENDKMNELVPLMHERKVEKGGASFQRSPINTRATEERRPGQHCKEPWELFGVAQTQLPRRKQILYDRTMDRLQIGPFLYKSVHLADPDLDLFSYIFNGEHTFSDEEIVKTDEDAITRLELMCLAPDTNIRDDVINVKVTYLNNMGSPLWYMNTFFAQLALEANSMERITRFANRMRRSFQMKFQTGIDKCDKMFIPILDSEGSHWYLMVVNMELQDVEIWDSLPSARANARRRAKVKHILNVLENIYSPELKSNETVSWSFNKFCIVQPSGVPAQPNGFDCGIFVIKWMEDIDNGRDIGKNYDSIQERIKLTLSIVKNCKNQVLPNLLVASQSKVQEDVSNVGNTITNPQQKTQPRRRTRQPTEGPKVSKLITRKQKT